MTIFIVICVVAVLLGGLCFVCYMHHTTEDKHAFLRLPGGGGGGGRAQSKESYDGAVSTVREKKKKKVDKHRKRQEKERDRWVEDHEKRKQTASEAAH